MPKKQVSEVDRIVDAGENYVAPTSPFKNKRLCGAKTRHNHDKNGGFCQLPAGFGTDHPGEGRCKYHGGATPRNSGRYSRLKKKELKTLVEEHELDPKPLDLEPDLAAARALFETVVEESTELSEALLRWNRLAKEGLVEEPPGGLPDLELARKCLETVGNLVAKVQKARAENAISRADFLRVLVEFGRVVEHEVEDKEVQERIKAGWLQVKL